VKILVIGFAILSLVFAALAVDEWDDRPDAGDPSATDRGALRGGLILLAVTLLAIGTLWLAAIQFGWRFDRALPVGVGLFLAAMTLVRPWWFWENAKARWLRGLVGDEPTAGIYLALAAAMVWLGLFAEWSFGPP
jgi:hypothetical protein